jgi:hypothetical protein
MTSTIKVNTITTESGSTLTVGESGKTIALASGASQTGFGRTGTVNWQTTKKTASFTAVSGEGYFVDTSSSAITATLPASPSAGDIVYIKDYTGTFGTNACTVARNSSNIRGATNNFDLAKDNAGAVFIYVDATEGWQVFIDGSDTDASNTFICASGGTETTCGDYKIHTFTGPGTFTVNSLTCCASRDKVDYIVVAGGGGGGRACAAGGGGAGGFRESHDSAISGTYTASPLATPSSLSVSVQGYPITVGGGGTGAPGPTAPSNPGDPGSNSVFSTITSAAGGGGGANPQPGSNGGSGGGGAHGSGTGGSGNTPPVSPAQGNDGGDVATPSPTTTDDAGGGGGGAIEAGNTDLAGEGGDGAQTSINGSATFYAGGGGGGSRNTPQSQSPAARAGGQGGGGTGGGSTSYPRPNADASGDAGTTNTGGGGGGATRLTPNPGGTVGSGGNGGSGIVIIRYKYQ